MSGEISALISAFCYALSNLLLRKGQRDTLPADNGLFPILFVSGTVLSFNLVMDLIDDPAPLIVGQHWGKNVLFCILAGVVATLFGRLALYAAIARIGATRGITVIAMAPVVTLVIAVGLLGERIHYTDVIGIGLLSVGIVLLVVEATNRQSRTARTWWRSGLVIAILAPVFQGIGYSFRKVGVTLPIDPIFASTLDTLAALFTYFAVLRSRGRLRQYFRFYVRNVNLYLVTSGFVTAAAVFFFFDAVSAAPVSTVSVIIGSQPVILAILSGIFLRKAEQLTWMTVASAAVVSAGVSFIGWH